MHPLSKWIKSTLLVALLLFLSGVPVRTEARQLFIIAHRGAMAIAPENTLPALQKALELKADALEIDLQLSKDGHLVLMHDSRVNRTTRSHGNVRELTLAQLKKLDAGGAFSETFVSTPIPTLEEVLALPRGETWLVIELKETGKAARIAEQNLLDTLKAHQAKQIILKSFDREQLARLRTAAPQYPQLYVMLGYFPATKLTIADHPSFHDPLAEPVKWLQWHRWFVSRDRIEQAHAAGKQVIAWSVNEDEHIAQMIALGIDGIETDRPDRVRELWLQFQQQSQLRSKVLP